MTVTSGLNCFFVACLQPWWQTWAIQNESRNLYKTVHQRAGQVLWGHSFKDIDNYCEWR